MGAAILFQKSYVHLTVSLRCHWQSDVNIDQCDPSYNPNLCTPLRRLREEYCIREVGTAASYECNDKIDSVENLTSPRCSPANVRVSILFYSVFSFDDTLTLNGY